MIPRSHIAQRLVAFTVVTSLYGAITFKPVFNLWYWIVATLVEVIFFLWLLNFINAKILEVRVEDRTRAT